MDANNSPKQIFAVIEYYESKSDIYGNRYNFVVFTETMTGVIAKGQISGGASNISRAMLELYGNWEDFKIVEISLPIRKFNAMIKAGKYPYIGCTPEEINKNVLDQWYKAKNDIK